MYLNSECKFINQVEDLREIVNDEIYIKLLKKL